MATFEDFMKLDIRVGTIIKAENFEKAKRPAYKLQVDFGEEIGIKKTSAQITNHYTTDDLIGKQVADFMSEVLVLGTYSDGGVILITPDIKAKNGDRLG